MTTAATPSLSPAETAGILAKLNAANDAFTRAYPGDQGQRQPVHTVYGGAQLFKADTAAKMGTVALGSLRDYAPNFAELARAVALPGYETLPVRLEAISAVERALEADSAAVRQINEPAWRAWTIYGRVVGKLEREAVEDFRIDFEDGYGNRPDPEEDRDAARCAEETARGLQAGTLPPFIGIRIKTFTDELHVRSIRTLDIFVSTLAQASSGKLPPNFVVTLPKVTHPEQVETLDALLDIIEAKSGLAPRSVKVEIMVEMPQSILDAEGKSPLKAMVAAAGDRCVGAHFGTYDYTAGCNITAAYQHMRHPVCDFAKHMMQVSLAGSGVMLSDGATNVMPIGPHRGADLTADQLAENRAIVHRAWKLHFDDVQHSLRNGYFQGWDLHPSQLPTRYAAMYSFFVESLEPATARLKNFIEKAAQATLVGDVFDDAATGQGLLNYFLRGISCGALTENEALVTGLTMAELRGRSFVKILANRKGK